MVVIWWFITMVNGGFSLQWIWARAQKYKSPESHSDCEYSVIFKQTTPWNQVIGEFHGNEVMESENFNCEMQTLKILQVHIFQRQEKNSHELSSKKSAKLDLKRSSMGAPMFNGSSPIKQKNNIKCHLGCWKEKRKMPVTKEEDRQKVRNSC